MWSKGIIRYIPKVKSQDKENRKRYEGKEMIPILPKIRNEYIKEAINYVNKNFKSNYGNTDNFNYPITHKDSESG